MNFKRRLPNKLIPSEEFLQNTPEIGNVWEYMTATLHLNPNHGLVRKIDILRKKQPDLASLIAEQVVL